MQVGRESLSEEEIQVRYESQMRSCRASHGVLGTGFFTSQAERPVKSA